MKRAPRRFAGQKINFSAVTASGCAACPRADIDTAPLDKVVLTVPGMMAEMELGFIKERQSAGDELRWRR